MTQIQSIFDFKLDNFAMYKQKILGNSQEQKQYRKQLRSIFYTHSTQVENLSELMYYVLAEIYEEHQSIHYLREESQNLFLAISTYKISTVHDFHQVFDYILTKHLAIQTGSQLSELSITDEGKKFVEGFYLNYAHGTFWGQKFLKISTVMYVTAFCLFFLSFLKIGIGIRFNSQGLVSEGFENLSDLFKIGIIALGVKFRKDRLASLIIIGMMIFTGIALLYTGITSLFHIEPVEVNKYTIVIVIISMFMNLGLLIYKGFVGRISENLSLLSDSKDSQLNVLISGSVLIGLIFGYFKIFWVDSIIGIIIAILCIKEGIEIFYEIWKSGEDFDVSKLHVATDAIIQSRISLFILYQIQKNDFTQDSLFHFLKNQTMKSERIFGGFANYFNSNLLISTFTPYINQLIHEKYITIDDSGVLHITESGSRFSEKKMKWERNHKTRHKRNHERSKGVRCLYVLFFWVLIGISIYAFIKWL